MLKKLLIAIVAVIAGMVVLNKVTKVSPMVWLGNCCSSVRHMVPPEVQLKQLNKEIGNIDNEIRKNIGRVAAMEEEVGQFERDVAAQRKHLRSLRTEITDMRTNLESPRFVRAEVPELTRKLDRTVTEYTCLKDRNKIHEKVLEEKKRALETAHVRLTKMKNEKENLMLLAERLANHLETVKMQQTGTTVEVDDSAINRCHELAKEIETRLNTAEREMKLLTKYGYRSASPVVEEGKSREEVLKAASKALEDDGGLTEKVSADKDEEK